MTRQVCLFAHYSTNSVLSKDVKHYLRELTLCKWEIHLSLSGQAFISEDTKNFCHQYKITPHLRENKGLDFGAWQELKNKGVTNDADYILLTNDSIFGPIYPLQPIFSDIINSQIDIWGMVETWEENWHYQSWFLCFNHRAFHHPTVEAIFNQPFGQMSKPEIIYNGELGLGRALYQHNELTSQAYWSPKSFRPFRNKKKTNPMHIDWFSALESKKVPFIKKELIRNNHFGVFWLNYYRAFLKQQTYFPLEYIDHYLQDYPNRPQPSIVWWKRFKYLATTYDTQLAWKYFLKQGVSCPIFP